MKRIIFSKLKEHKSGNTVIKLIKQNKAAVFFIFFLLLGMIFGTLCVGMAEDNIIENLDFLFASNFKIRSEQSLFEIFSTSLTSSFIFVIIMLLLGLSIWGSLTVPAIVFFRGLGLGLTAGFLYSHYGAKGFLYHLVVLLPGVLISSIAIVLQAKESASFSIKLASKILPKGSLDKLWNKFKLYLLRTGYVFIILVISSVADMLFTMLFSRYFNF